MELNAQSNFDTSTAPWNMTLSPDSGIRHAFAFSTSAFGSVLVAIPQLAVTPVVSLSGPSVVSLCGSNSIFIQATISGTGGRVPSIQWKANSVVIPNANSPRLNVTRPSEPAVVIYRAIVTNFAGKSSSSDVFPVTFTSDARAQVSLSSPASFAVDSSSAIDVSAIVNLPVQCVPQGFSIADARYRFRWNITLASDPEQVVSAGSSVSLNRSRLLINPASSLPPGAQYKIEVEVDPRIAGVLVGRASTVVRVNAVPVVAALSVPTVLSIERSRNVTLSASRSCDPNRASPQCRPIAGQTAEDFSGLSFQWTCRDGKDDDCDGVLDDRLSSRVVIAGGTLSAANSPYTFFANVSSSLPASPWSLTPNITVNVLPDPPPACVRPSIEMQAFPAKINVGQSGEAQLRSSVRNFDFNPREGRNYSWFLVSRATGQLSSPAALVGDGISLNQPNLALQLSRLIPGSSYVFRLVATLPCTGGNDVFGEIAFTTNAPPSGGVLSVSPMSGRAGLDEFTLVVDGASDEDLPLQYSFEYRTDFEAADALNSAFFTLSAFSQSASISTRFAKAPRIMVIVRIRDALQAVTARAQSPFVDNVEAVDLIVSNTGPPPFNASAVVQDLLGGGGSQEDALRAASALVAAATTQGPVEDLPDAVIEWKQQTQNTLLNLVADTEVTDPDPSFIMLQTSTLSSILSSAEDIQDVTTPEGQQFLSKAADLVAGLLANAQSAILAQGSGKDDPLLSQYRPGNLGDITVNNLVSILNTIRSSSLNARRRRRRVLREDPGRWLQAQEASQQISTSVRDQLRKLADVMLLGAISGSAPQVIKGAEMRIVTVSEIPSQIGTDSKLTTISIPAFNESDPPTVFTLPRDVLGQFAFNSEEDLVNIIAVRFRFNVRDLMGEVLPTNLTLDEDGPISSDNITEILALDFQRNFSDGTLHPINLADGIQIRIPLPYQPMDNTTRPSCGFFNETLSAWSSAGCNATEIRLPTDPTDTTGYMICECNHASDYAAWMAFVKDVNSVFNPVDTSNLSTIAAVVLGVLLPITMLLWIASQRLANYMDKRDSDYVHYGAFVAMTKRKLELHDRQRRFFSILRDNKGPIAKADLSRYEAMADEDEQRLKDEQMLQAFRALARRLMFLVLIGSLASSALMFSGIAVSFFFNSDERSLVEISSEMNGAHADALGTAIASGVFSLVSGLLLLFVFAFRGGEISPGIVLSRRFGLLLVLQLVNVCLAISAFAVPLAHMPSYPTLSGVGIGLTLLIIAGSIAVVTFFLTFVGLFLHQLGEKVRWLGLEFVNNIAKGLIYEQTLLSAFTRFDPYFDRSKRFSIVVAVIIGNLFACSVFFSLRNGEGVSFGVVLASTVISSLIVAIPVKIALRVLFRVTKTREGSKLDRIAHIFRITAFSNDVHPAFVSEAEKLDVEMLDAFKRFYLAKQNVKILNRALAAKAAQKAKENDERPSLASRLKACCARARSLVVDADDDDEYDDDNKHEEIIVAAEGAAGDDRRSKSFRKKVNSKTGDFEYGSGELMDVRTVTPDQITPALLSEARRQYSQTRRELKSSVGKSQKAWAGQEFRFSYVSRKQWLVQREKNAFLKWALAVAEEPHVRPKVTDSILSHRWSILAWAILLAYYIGCILWICFWIFSRNGQSKDALVLAGNPNPTNAEIAAQTNAYLLAWLATSFFGVFLGYFVFEPALVVLRFAILPMFLKALRPLEDLKPEDVPIEGLEAEMGLSTRNIPRHLMPEPEEEKHSLLTRVLCCCCSARTISRMQKQFTNGIVMLIEALV